MVVHERLASLERIMEEAKKLPLSSKITIDKDEVMAILREIKVALPDELKQAKWISEERQKIIVEAHMEAESILAEAKAKIEKHDITLRAQEKAEKIIESARTEAGKIREASRDYADSILADVQKKFSEFSEIIKKNREELK